MNKNNAYLAIFEHILTVLILLGFDFTDLKHYTLLKLFQISWMAVDRFSLVNEKFLLISTFNVLLDLHPECSMALSLILYGFTEENI